MFKIGEFSKLCQVPTSVLRYYDEIGIFKPKHVDPFTGYRYYSMDQFHDLSRILALRDLDLSLTEISEIIHNNVTLEEIKGMLRLKQIQLTQQQAEVQAKLHRVENRLKQIESENKMPEYEVVVKPAEAFKMASIRETVPTIEEMPARCGAMFKGIADWLQSRGTHPMGPALAIYHNPEYTVTDIDVENGFVVESNLEEGQYTYADFTITVSETPKDELVASIVHKGDYDLLRNAWQTLARWIEEHNYEGACHPPREFYLTPPGEPPVTEVQYFVKHKAS